MVIFGNILKQNLIKTYTKLLYFSLSQSKRAAIISLFLYENDNFFTPTLKSLLETTIVPVIKNKCGSLTDCNNYRPIAIATITSKLLESNILLKCEEYFFTSDNQFGFKAGHSTEFCIYSLLEFTRKETPQFL